ncbi:MAG: 4-hydroxy-3-methylbut-2-enyl diphosphate reductase [Clostridia bacterium]|nr:4-hydroxy-3-methylbut-2-enyl diphosphate reductase [Clostridia bacterium]
MEVIIGKTAGFCYGVRRAVEGAKEELENSNEKIECLGEIVHNKQVIQSLESKGLVFIDDIKKAKGKVIIRAHGVEKKIYEIGKEKGIKLKDYTCPNVLKIHKIVEEYSKKGYYIFLCGSPNHPENIGTISYCGNRYSVIEKEEDVSEALEKLEKSKINKLLLISQTTYSMEKFCDIEKCIKDEIAKEIELIVKNTICHATEVRQKETQKLSKEVDFMIIVGGKNSSNTKKLYNISKENCNKSICVETKHDIDIEEIRKYNKIGIMAGASTPQEVIQEIVEEIENDSKIMINA